MRFSPQCDSCVKSVFSMNDVIVDLIDVMRPVYNFKAEWESLRRRSYISCDVP